MAGNTKRTFSLPEKHAKFIDSKVGSGSYASGSEVVRAGLRALQERDAAIERWLREDVARVYDAMKSDPSRAVPMDRAFDMVKARHAAKSKKHRAKA
jgi:antitoxin ParD1/3/4